MARQRKGTLIWKPTKGWCGRITATVEGETVKLWYVFGTENKAVARRKLAREVAKLAKGAPSSPDVATVEETVAEYAVTWIEERKALKKVMAKEEQRNIVAHALPEIGHLGLSAVRYEDVNAVLSAAVAKGLKKGTVRHVRGALKRMFKSARQAGLLKSKDGATLPNPVDRELSPMPAIKEVEKKRVTLTDEEFVRLMCSDVDIELRLMCLVARFEGGLRTSDIHTLDWGFIDLGSFATWEIYRSKTSDFQKIELAPPVGEALRLRWEHRGKPMSGPIFPCRRGPRAGEQKKLRGNSYATRLRRALLSAGIIRHKCARPADAPKRKRDEPCCPNLAHDPLFSETAKSLPTGFHAMRSAFISAGAASGENAQTMMKLAHHTDAKVHQGYVDDLPAMQRIPAGVVPKLPLGLFRVKTRAVSKPPGRSELSAARPAGFEPATRGLEGDIRLGNGRSLQDSAIATGERGASKSAVSEAPCLSAVSLPRPWFLVAGELGPEVARLARELPASALDDLLREMRR